MVIRGYPIIASLFRASDQSRFFQLVIVGVVANRYAKAAPA
jgi:hypothetical protein